MTERRGSESSPLLFCDLSTACCQRGLSLSWPTGQGDDTRPLVSMPPLVSTPEAYTGGANGRRQGGESSSLRLRAALRRSRGPAAANKRMVAGAGGESRCTIPPPLRGTNGPCRGAPGTGQAQLNHVADGGGRQSTDKRTSGQTDGVRPARTAGRTLFTPVRPSCRAQTGSSRMCPQDRMSPWPRRPVRTENAPRAWPPL